MKARSFFYVSAGLLCLALAYHLGAASARAQAPTSQPMAMVGDTGSALAITATGDAFYTQDNGVTWAYRGNMFSGPTPATQESWGRLKARYR